MANHRSILAWKIPWTEESGRLQSMGSLRVGHNWTNTKTPPYLPLTTWEVSLTLHFCSHFSFLGCLPSLCQLTSNHWTLFSSYRHPLLVLRTLMFTSGSVPYEHPWHADVSNVCACVLSCFMSDLCAPVVCSPPASSVHGIPRARILEWVAISSSRGSSWPRDWIQVSCVGRWESLPLSRQGSFWMPVKRWSVILN